MNRPVKARAGFTIIEVMVALAILALAAIVLGAAYVNVLNSYAIAGRSRDADEDVKFARMQLLAEPDVKKLEVGNDFESVGDRKVRWTARAEPTAIADLFTVTFECEVTDLTQLEPRKITETFMLLRPTWSDPLERAKLREEARARIAELQLKKE